MDGGATYHTRYDSYEFVRGQEKDPWKAEVAPDWDSLRRNTTRPVLRPAAQQAPAAHHQSPVHPGRGGLPLGSLLRCRDRVPREERQGRQLAPAPRGLRPAQPFQAPERFRASFPTPYDGPILDWPPQGRLDAWPAEIAELRANYHANLALCDELLGRLLDHFDAA
ncbi:MAG: hypothetical protein R3D28_20780 [Geminicoccaceae bacterium]